MIGWQRKYREIKELIGQTGKRVLLVEGSDDAFVLRILLSRRSESDWEMRWTLAKAGSKKIVTDILLHEPNWFGIVNFQKKLYHVSELPTVEQLQKWVHGKRFFLDHVHSVLNRYFGQSDAQTWMKKIFTTCVLPDDLEPLWSRIEPD